MTVDLPTVLLGLAALLAGLSKGGLGGPIPVAMIAPLLSLAMPVSDSVGIVLPMLIFADVFALRLYWRQWNIYHLRLMLPAALVGVVSGALTLGLLADSDGLLRFILGLFTLVAVGYKLISDRLKSLEYRHRRWHGYLAGWATAFGSALANTGAPQYTAYMLLQKVPPVQFIGTATLFFAIVNLLKLPAFLAGDVLNIDRIISILWVAPIIPLGVWLGRWAVDWLEPDVFERILLVMLFILGVYLIITSLAA